MASRTASRFESEVIIPLRSICAGDSNGQEEEECIIIEASELPPPEDVITLLRNEDSSADLWHRVALLYYRNGDSNSFLLIANEGYRQKQASHNSDSKLASVVPLLLSMGGYFYMMATANEGEDDKNQASKSLQKAINFYTRAASLGVRNFEKEHLVGRAYIYLMTGEKDNADKHFSFILSNLDPSFIPAIVGKAMLSFSQKDYTTALQFYRQALRLDPYSPANVRVGIGHCFWKLNQRDKAKLAYERAVELYPNDYNALCSLAIYHLSTMKREEVMRGMEFLAKAHSICPTNPATLLYLADHYFHKKEYDKALNMALDACKNARIDDILKRSAYLAGRCYQAKEEYEYAMHYYYQALSEDHAGFYLPYFGLAQSYLKYGDIPNCTKILHKLLHHDPNNHFAMRMLGSLECTSLDPVVRKSSQTLLKAVLERDPDDVWTRLSLATSMEAFDDNLAFKNYSQAVSFMKSRSLEIDPEVYNNLGCTLFRLGRYQEADAHFDKALEVVLSRLDDVATYDKGSLITLNFNRARAKEALHEFGIAEPIYKEILKTHPSYFSCFIRLAVIYRDRNNLHEADAYFKEALQCSLEHPDVWAYIGNLHLTQGETLPAQNKFLRILQMKHESLEKDSYSLIALANVSMSKMFNCMFNTNAPAGRQQMKDIQAYMERALSLFGEILEREPNNIWAANGAGCILAAKGLFTEARAVFSDVREATQDFQDVWINIANTYLEQNLYFNAIQMYERCNKRFSVNTDIKLLQCLAKAYYYNKSFQEAKITFLKCLRVAPYDKTIIFGLAKTLRKLGWQPFQVLSGNPDLSAIFNGLELLKQAKKMFEGLSSKQSNSSAIISAAGIEAQHCDDLMKQAPHMISRIKAEFTREQELKNKREREFRALKEEQRRQEALKERQKRKAEEEALKQREAVRVKVEKVKQTLEQEALYETKKRERRIKKEKDREELVDNSVDDGNDYGVIPEAPPPAKKPRSRKKKDSKPLGFTEAGVESPSNNQVGEPVTSGKKSYSRITVQDFSDDSDENASNPVVITQPVKVRVLSPDITCLPPISSVSVTIDEKDSVSSCLDESEEDCNTLMDKDDNLLYLDIFIGNQSETIKSKNVGEEAKQKTHEEEDSSIYEDLPPPVLTNVYEELWKEPEDDVDDTSPPVLHSIYSEDEEETEILEAHSCNEAK